ncbi:MAG: hypothetical protein RBU37_18065 [Myxococcota bacterium]|jgi:hypothetical protein|nr:hypothetical protein [Myxococcota bacterium]
MIEKSALPQATSSTWRLAQLLKTHAATLFTLVVLAGIATGSGLLAFQASRERALTPPAIWMLDASEQRVEYYRGALWGGESKGKVKDPAFIDASFGPHGGLPSLMPAIIANAKASTWTEASNARIAMSVNAVFFGLFVLLVGLMGLEAGGGIGGLFAAIGAALTPRIFGLGASVNFGMSALFFLTLSPYLLHRARSSLTASVLAIFAIAASVHVGVLGLFVWVPWLYLSFIRGRWPRGGLSETPPVPLRLLFIIPLGLLLGFLAYPYIWHQSKAHLNIWLTHFLRQAAEPFSYAGEVWGHRRIPWHAGPYLLAVTTPPALLVLAVFGWRAAEWYQRVSAWRGFGWLRHLPFAPEGPTSLRSTGLTPLARGRREALRLAAFCLVLTLSLPLLLRTPYFAAIDLIALSVPWLLVFAAAGAERLLAITLNLLRRVQRFNAGPGWLSALSKGSIATAVVMLLLSPMVIEAVRMHPFYEAYYNWFVGGPDGARLRSLPRYPKGPVPLDLLDKIAEHSGGQAPRLAFMMRGKSEAALQRSLRENMRRIPIQFRDQVHDAQVIVFEHDDLDPRYEDAFTEFYGAEREDNELLLRYEVDGVAMYSVSILPP